MVPRLTPIIRAPAAEASAGAGVNLVPGIHDLSWWQRAEASVALMSDSEIRVLRAPRPAMTDQL